MTKVILKEIQVKTAENDQLIKWITENENLIFFLQLEWQCVINERRLY